jgi:hypothetical protein
MQTFLCPLAQQLGLVTTVSGESSLWSGRLEFPFVISTDDTLLVGTRLTLSLPTTVAVSV